MQSYFEPILPGGIRVRPGHFVGKGKAVLPLGRALQRHIPVLFGQAGGALGAQHIQSGHNGGADVGRIAGRVG